MNVTISNRALTLIKNETSRWPELETGGVLLGYRCEDSFHILEAVDGGYSSSVIRQTGCFMYDQKYVEHISEQLINLYNPPLELVGVWHKHNYCSEPIFSDEDCLSHILLCKAVDNAICSLLVYRKNNDGSKQAIHTFVLSKNGSYQTVCLLDESDEFQPQSYSITPSKR